MIGVTTKSQEDLSRVLFLWWLILLLPPSSGELVVILSLGGESPGVMAVGCMGGEKPQLSRAFLVTPILRCKTCANPEEHQFWRSWRSHRTNVWRELQLIIAVLSRPIP